MWFFVLALIPGFLAAPSLPISVDPNTLAVKCPANSTFRGCASACEPKCGDPELMMCTMQCMPAKCQCDSEYRRNSKGDCVLEQDCDNAATKMPCLAKCGANQKCVLKQVVCVKAPCNPIPTCVAVTDPTPAGSGCAAVSCVVGQECVVGADGAGRCQLPAATNCSLHEIWDPCTGCEAKCGDQLPIACAKICRRPGKCRCGDGFLRNKEGQCVTQNECDVQTVPPLTCATVLCTTGTTCVMSPSNRPQCLPVDPVPPTIPPTCKANEVFNSCGGCDAKCSDTEPMMCPAICKLEGSCLCKNGFFRDSQGACVTRAQCDDKPKPRDCQKVPKITCANVRCAGPCVDTPEGPTCNPRPITELPLAPTCEVTDCRDGFECVMAKNVCKAGEFCRSEPACIPINTSSCKTTKCTSGKKCIMQQVQCFAPPCYPVPQCVDDPSQAPGPCATMKCRAGFKCVETTVNCIMSPCDMAGTTGQCVPDDEDEHPLPVPDLK